MAELVKNWDSGGTLSVSYTGVGNGQAVFSSDTNEGLDRQMQVVFSAGNEQQQRVVKQQGRREIFYAKDGILKTKDGGTINVIKQGLK